MLPGWRAQPHQEVTTLRVPRDRGPCSRARPPQASPEQTNPRKGSREPPLGSKIEQNWKGPASRDRHLKWVGPVLWDRALNPWDLTLPLGRWCQNWIKWWDTQPVSQILDVGKKILTHLMTGNEVFQVNSKGDLRGRNTQGVEGPQAFPAAGGKPECLHLRRTCKIRLADSTLTGVLYASLHSSVFPNIYFYYFLISMYL